MSSFLFQTVIVSMLLRYAHHQIFVFIGEFFHISFTQLYYKLSQEERRRTSGGQETSGCLSVCGRVRRMPGGRTTPFSLPLCARCIYYNQKYRKSQPQKRIIKDPARD